MRRCSPPPTCATATCAPIPSQPAAVLKAVLKARDLVGTFEKPRYVAFDAGLCAHSRSRIVGCTRCLDLCPAGAISPAGDHVAISAEICAGCGQCAAACPTGAASYALPPADALMRKLRTLLVTYREAGGGDAIVLLHDAEHGDALIDALARFGDGLPANVLPVAVNEVTQVGLDAVAAAFAFGASAVRFLLRERPRHDVAGLRQTLGLAQPILDGLGFGGERVATIETDDPEALGTALRAIGPMPPAPRPASFVPSGGKRDALRVALRELHRVGAGAGRCGGAARAGAVRRGGDRRRRLHALPRLRLGLPDRRAFRQPRAADAALHRGRLRAVRPVQGHLPREGHLAEAAARLPRRHGVRARAQGGGAVLLHPLQQAVRRQEHHRAGDHPSWKGSHWMYQGQGGTSRLDVIRMCDDCRVAVISDQDFDPYGAPPRAHPRTTEDYLREREEAEEGVRPLASDVVISHQRMSRGLTEGSDPFERWQMVASDGFVEFLREQLAPLGASRCGACSARPACSATG